MKRPAWKATERAIALVLGGTRVPVSGRQRGDAPDIRHRWISVEVKARKALPAWLVDAMAQARASATAEQLPMVVLHEQGHPHRGDYVVMRLCDFADWFGDISECLSDREWETEPGGFGT